MPAWAEVTLALLAFFGVSGTIAPFIAKRFHKGAEAVSDERLKNIFATHDELNGFRGSIQKAVSECCDRADSAAKAAQLAIARTDDNASAIAKMQNEQERLSDMLVEQVLEPLKELTREQKEVGKALAAQTAVMVRIEKEWDRYRLPPKP